MTGINYYKITTLSISKKVSSLTSSSMNLCIRKTYLNENGQEFTTETIQNR